MMIIPAQIGDAHPNAASLGRFCAVTQGTIKSQKGGDIMELREKAKKLVGKI